MQTKLEMRTALIASKMKKNGVELETTYARYLRACETGHNGLAITTMADYKKVLERRHDIDLEVDKLIADLA